MGVVSGVVQVVNRRAMSWFDLLSGALLVSVNCGIVAVLVWGVMTD
jgi:hypothetical protein